MGPFPNPHRARDTPYLHIIIDEQFLLQTSKLNIRKSNKEHFYLLHHKHNDPRALDFPTAHTVKSCNKEELTKTKITKYIPDDIKVQLQVKHLYQENIFNILETLLKQFEILYELYL